MKKENKKIMRDILQGNDLEMNLPAYANAYINATYEYSLIHLVLNYYTIKEIQDETNGIAKDEYLSTTVDKLHTMMFQTIIANDYATIQVIEVRGCKTSAIQRHQRTQFGGNNGNYVHYHPLGAVVAVRCRH